MAYNWNAELCQQRKHRFWMQISLGLSALTFVAVIGVLAYYLADLRAKNTPAKFSVMTWDLRS